MKKPSVICFFLLLFRSSVCSFTLHFFLSSTLVVVLWIMYTKYILFALLVIQEHILYIFMGVKICNNCNNNNKNKMNCYRIGTNIRAFVNVRSNCVVFHFSNNSWDRYCPLSDIVCNQFCFQFIYVEHIFTTSLNKSNQ